MTTVDIETVRRIAAFPDGDAGGNPAGVLIADNLPSEIEMRDIAAKVGYSETAFAARDGDHWRVRYFAPQSEVDFCGHATIALGSVLAETHGPGTYPLKINTGDISVTSARDDSGRMQVRLVSPPTRSRAAEPGILSEALNLFGLNETDLDGRIPPAIANAGNDHLVLALKRRDRLAAMAYDLSAGRDMMSEHGLTTISLLHVESDRRFNSRNAFAIGGVTEDPATGAAAAALGGYLRDINWPHEGHIEIRQGADMGAPSVLFVSIPDGAGEPVSVSGSSRNIA